GPRVIQCCSNWWDAYLVTGRRRGSTSGWFMTTALPRRCSPRRTGARSTGSFRFTPSPNRAPAWRKWKVRFGRNWHASWKKTVTSTVDRSKLPEALSTGELKLPKFQRATLSNGLKVVLAERHDTPMVNLWLQVRAGSASDDAAKLGGTKLMTSVLAGGTKSRD